MKNTGQWLELCRESSNPIPSRAIPLTSLHKRASPDIDCKRLAIEQARLRVQTTGGDQVGAVLVKDGQVVCRGFNEASRQHDPTAHAEMVTIRRLCADLKTETLAGYTLYCTLQPCGMCSMACLWAGISRIVYGAGRDDVSSIYFESRHFNTVDFIRQAFRDDLEIKGGVLADECAKFYTKTNPSPEVAQDAAHSSAVPPL